MRTNRRKGYHKVALLYAMISGLLMVIGIQPVHAASPASWSRPYNAPALQVGPDNLPRAVDCNGRSSYAYNEDGTSKFTITTVNLFEPIDVGCANYYSWNSMRLTESISALGNTVATADTNSDYSADLIRLYDDTGGTEWNYSVLDECSNTGKIGASPIIANGVVVFTYASCNSPGEYFLKGLDETDGTVVYNTSLGSVDSYLRLGWYEDGVTFFSGTKRYFYSDAGVEDTNLTIDIGNEQQLTYFPDGSVVYFRHDDIDYNVCYFVFHTYGETDISKVVDCNATISAPIEPLPNGDFAYISDSGTTTGIATITIVHKPAIKADTVLTIEPPADMVTGMFYGVNFFYVDVNGTIVVPFNYSGEYLDPTTQNTSIVERTAFYVYSPNGKSQYRWTSESYGDEDVTVANGTGN